MRAQHSGPAQAGDPQFGETASVRMLAGPSGPPAPATPPARRGGCGGAAPPLVPDPRLPRGAWCGRWRPCAQRGRFRLAAGVAMITSGAVGVITATATCLPWLWPALATSARHHPDTLLAAVLLAGSLGAVWRMSR